MAFLDEARQLAEQATRSIEQGLDQVRGRIDELQKQRHLNDLARYLGLLVYRARRAGTQPDEIEVERVCSEMAAVEATLPGGPTPPGPGTSGTTAPGPGTTGPGTTRPDDTGATGPDTTATGTTDPGSPPTSGPPAGPPRGYSLDDV
jgi:hypothetical protein